MNAQHQTKTIELNGEEVEIDMNMIPLITVLNRYGIKTLNCCQGTGRGYIAIDLDNVDVWSGLVNKKHSLSFNLRFPTKKAIEAGGVLDEDWKWKEVDGKWIKEKI